MARIRSIKPEYWTSEQVTECSRDARLLFIGLWNFCDDGGIHPASAKRLKMEIFPGDDCTAEQVGGWIQELLSQGLLKEFEVEGAKYWLVTGWHHQKIDRPSFKYPQPQGLKENRRSLDESSSNDRRTPPPGRDVDLDVDVEGKGTKISSEIFSLRERYPNRDLLDRVFAAIAGTRKTGRLADSIVFRQLQAWDKYPVQQVEASFQKYLAKNYAAEGKDEKYLLGIIRRSTATTPDKEQQSDNDWLKGAI